MKHSDRRWQMPAEWVALVGVGALLGMVVMLHRTASPDGYEISLYHAYPPAFWILLGLSILSGTYVLIRAAFDKPSGIWIVGILLFIASNAALLLLPIIRGYWMYGRSDAMTHLGLVQDLSSLGNLDGNIYPPMHVLTLSLADATSLEPATVALWVPLGFSIVYFGSWLLLVRLLIPSRRRRLVVLPFVMLPLLRGAYLGFRPFDLSLLLVPLIFYLFFKGQHSPTPAVRAIFVVCLVGFVLYHPLTAFFMVIILGIYTGIRMSVGADSFGLSPTNVFSLTAAAVLAWYSSFSGIILRFERVYWSLFGVTEGETVAQTYQRTAEQSSPALVDLARVGTFRYGLEFLLFGLGFCYLLYAFLRSSRGRSLSGPGLWLFGTCLVTFSIGGLAFLFYDLIVPPYRPFQIGKIGAILLVGYLASILFATIQSARGSPWFVDLARGTIMVTVLILVLLSIFTVYSSPLASETNHHVTEMEVHGAEWVTERGDASDDLMEFGISNRRFFEAHRGTEQSNPFMTSPPPDRFGFHENPTLGSQLDDDTYLTITHRGRIVYPAVFPSYRDQWRYRPEDFDRLEQDDTVSRIYDNGDYTQYLVTAESV